MNPNFQLAPGEYFQICPYNKSHEILNTKIGVHLSKCRANYIKENNGKEEIIGCMYDFTHKVHKLELEYHHSTCPARHTVVATIEHQQREETKAKNLAHRVEDDERARQRKQMGLDNDEEWEEDSRGNGPGYDPQWKLSQGDVIPITPQGMTPSERRAFANRQRDRQSAHESEKAQKRGGTAKHRKS